MQPTTTQMFTAASTVPARPAGSPGRHAATGLPFDDDALWGTLKQALTDFAKAPGGRLVYVANHGNAGDALIASGAWQLFDLLGVQPLQIRTRQLQLNDRAIFGGGGNFIADYRDCQWFMERCLHLQLPRVLLLPHTVRGHCALLGAMDDRFTLFCREQPSLDWARRHAPRANVSFGHELALGIDLDRLARRAGDQFGLPLDLVRRPRQLMRYIRWRQRSTRVKPQADGRLQVFRCDVERTADSIGPPDQDLSNLYGSSFHNRADCDRISREFLKVLSAATTVQTNRLHVGIGSALLGKQVLLHDNAYGKLRDIFDASLSGLPNVQFMHSRR